MKQVKQYNLLATSTFLLLLGSVAQAEVILFDGFENRDLSATNADGFTWNHPNRTSLVIQHPTDGNVVVMKANGDPAYNIINDERNWTAHEGDVSMRFRYPAGENWSEQRFSLGQAYRDIWISFWLRVPHNFKHETNPNGDGSRTNQKLFAIWMDGYSTKGDGPTVIWGPWSDLEGGSTLSGGYSIGGNTVTGSQIPSVPFITYPDDQGRWMHLVFHLKAATNDTSNDGVIELWRRWKNEADYTQLHQVTDANIAPPSAGPDGWAHGYLMGWANAPYLEDTEFLLDNFTVSTSSPFIDAIPPSAPVLSIN